MSSVGVIVFWLSISVDLNTYDSQVFLLCVFKRFACAAGGGADIADGG